jgi:hypothetical protein
MRARTGQKLLLVLAALLGAACGRSQSSGDSPAPPGVAGAAGMAGAGPACVGGDCEPVPLSSHGVVPVHRLRSTEYENSIYDLFGIGVQSPAKDERKPYEAAIDDARPWFEAVSQLASELFDRGDFSEPLVCVGSEVERACALSVIDELGRRAFRRPLLDPEQQAFVALFDSLAASDGSRIALEDVVRALLLSPSFLFHVELSDDPDGTAAEALDSYALAARLSFALWGSTPDVALLDAAASGLTDDSALGAAYDRLANDPLALGLADGLGEVWLGARELALHEVDSSVFPGFTAELRQSMQVEQREVLRQYWLGQVPLKALPLLDLSFVSPALATHYGFSAGSEGFVEETADARRGLLGQGAFLTLTSLPRRVSASHRGVFVAERLLCQTLPVPPPGEAGSLGADFPAESSERESLEQSLADPSCQGCHQLFDPFGLALAEFDAIGAFRTQDSRRQPIDAAVALPRAFFPDTPSVNGALELGQALHDSEVFQRCVAQQLASYLIHRSVTDETDADLIRPLTESISGGGKLTELTRSIVMSDHFRYRRLPAGP